MTLKVRLIGFPDIRKRLQGDVLAVDLDGVTLGDLARWLQRTHGDPVRTRLLRPEGTLDESVQVVRNGRETIRKDRMDYVLSEGDEITFLVFIAGG